MCEIIYEDVKPNEQYESTIKKVLKECYEVENLVNSKLIITVTFTTPENIRKINNKFRNIDRATDVLSFPLIDFDNEDLPNDGSKIYLGDIIISIERAKEQANEYGHSLDREVGFLTAHSMLHLLGYDHMVPEEEKVMFAKQEEILSNLGLKR